MELAAPVLITLCCATAFAAGWRLGGVSARAGALGASAALALIAVRVLFRIRPEWEQPLLFSNAYAAVQLYWVFPVTVFSLGIGARRSTTPALRPACAGVAALLVAVAVAGAWPVSANVQPAEANGDGVVLQTEDYTCGAAAAATLLGQLGVPAGEGEMARLCGSATWLGTTENALCRGLRIKLGATPFGVALERPDGERVFRFMRPVLARIRADAFRDHWVVLLAINDRVAILGDPALGRVEMPVAEFLRARRGVTIVVDKTFLPPE